MLAGALFALLSLLSLHFGSNQLMGPGGAAAAGAIYTAAGLGAYLVIAALLVVAVRCFRGVPFCTGPIEATAVLLLLGAVAILLHLPFEGQAATYHGPGGLLGQLLGEVAATFIGVVGAALVGATMLFVSLLLLSAIRLHEVVVILGWGARQTARASWAGVCAAGRVARAMLPERDDRAGADADDTETDVEEDEGGDESGELGDGRAVSADGQRTIEVRDEDIRAVRQLVAARGARAQADSGDEGEDQEHEEESDGVPRLRDDDDELSGGVRIGAPRTVSDPAAAQRAALAEVFAELAAVERRPERVLAVEDEELGDDQPAIEEERPLVAMPIVPVRAAVRAGSAIDDEPAASASAPGPIIVEPLVPRERDKQAGADSGPGFIKLGEGAFKLPVTDLLEYQPPQAPDMDKQALYDMAERLEQAMSNYGVRGKVREIHMGPVVTMYEFAPAPGTRTGKIANLEKDLAMALEAQAVRIVAPIPGKAVVGVEVPNRSRETVYLKEILEDSCFSGANSKLQVGLGKDIKGAPVSVNLAKMPHLLVAGTTGSGKSVAVNSMITSVLYNASPEEVRFIMVDPKMLELSIYEGIPHLLLPVVTDPKKANLALRWAVEEMERRYELLAKTGVRDIGSYNAKVDQALSGKSGGAPATSAASGKKIKVMLAGPDGTEQEVELSPEEAAPTNPDGVVLAEPPSEEDLSGQAAAAQAARANAEPPPRKLPYIVIVIDEFADLMMVAPKDVETSVARLAQKARAAGLHLILATQRPSVDVITGLIKANFPSRIALQVASKIDSRTILDTSGAETLLGNGDMLFSDRGTKLRRIHGAFLSDDEVHRVVEFLKTQAKPVYDMEILKPREEDAEDGAPADDFHDEFYDQAVAIVCETRQASVSFIQRRLQIGYNRAARLVEQMEREGIVGPANGAKPREIIAPPGEYLQHAP